MQPSVFLALALGLLGGLALRSWRRTRSSQRRDFRNEWGVIRESWTTGDGHADEEWRTLSAIHATDESVDSRTWTDLDMDGVLAALDRTRTMLGRQRFYSRLRGDIAWPAWADRLVDRCLTDQTFRELIATPLGGAGASLGRGFWRIVTPNAVIIRWWYLLFPVLGLGMLTSLLATAFDLRALMGVAVFGLLNMTARIAASWQVPGLLTPMQQLAPLVNAAERLASVDGLLVAAPVTAAMIAQLAPLGRIGRWVGREPASADEGSVYEFLNVFFLLDANALLFLARRLRALVPVLQSVAQWVGDVDLALGVASLRAEPRRWCVPELNDASQPVATGIWHPLVAEPSPNDVELIAHAGIIVTGANMSGKSTYLRAVAIAAVLARALHCCPAERWQGRALRVRSLMGHTDDLSTGRSYYLVEAERVVEMLRLAAHGPATLFLLDELLRGTNTVERLAAGESVLRGLLSTPEHGHVVLVATHDGELVQLLADCYAPWHFREEITPDGLVFDYTRREGPASTRTAIALLEACGAEASLVAAARARAEQLDNFHSGRVGS